MTVEIKRLVDCTIAEGVEAWNIGFEGYFFDATTTAEKFISRLVQEGLSPHLSIVAFIDNKPIGIVKNGIREFNGKKLAWNGGTGVASELRNKGIGKILMDATLAILKDEQVDYATLEAISENEKAISLYEKLGYEIVDQLEYLSLKGKKENTYVSDHTGGYKVERAIPQQVGNLSFYKGMNPWQTQWQSAKEGEALIVKDSCGCPLGYAYYRKVYDTEDKHINTVLYQCEAEQGHEDTERIIKCLLHEVFGNLIDDINRVIPNLPIEKSKITYSILKEMGFDAITRQVYMIKKM
ncbi:GNAT superfamily N-acetyltransferase [Cytobacillus eiseniae]|uniref:GNAT superfamily N-acetyltransferase n=1 Tax=Cytobacillus eiseniae TaxID=762947 RepID=A0ABS4RAV1_9BACI|nr:GNAT family N-acetyltransferase [Cytobacillus eiseniae]MBP2239501.1 GNAT superfamily N-acetyltransferase [Cytobacillus eiseniae]